MIRSTTHWRKILNTLCYENPIEKNKLNKSTSRKLLVPNNGLGVAPSYIQQHMLISMWFYVINEGEIWLKREL